MVLFINGQMQVAGLPNGEINLFKKIQRSKYSYYITSGGYYSLLVSFPFQ